MNWWFIRSFPSPQGGLPVDFVEVRTIRGALSRELRDVVYSMFHSAETRYLGRVPGRLRNPDGSVNWASEYWRTGDKAFYQKSLLEAGGGFRAEDMYYWFEEFAERHGL